MKKATYQPKNPIAYTIKAKETLRVFRKTGGNVEKTATKLNRGVRTVYRHLGYLGYEFPGVKPTRDKLGRIRPLEKGAYLENLKKVKINGK